MHRPQETTLDAVVDAPRPQPERQQLPARHPTVLALGEGRYRLVESMRLQFATYDGGKCSRVGHRDHVGAPPVTAGLRA